MSMIEFKKNVLLRNHTTFKIGGPARYFYEAKTKKDLVMAIKFSREKGIPFFILGGGSNVLVGDKGFEGMVIKMQNTKCKMQNDNSKCKIIYAEAGMELDDLVKLSLKNSLTGLEWAAGIPRATVGGALCNNAGAFDSSIADIVKGVEVFDVADSKIKNLTKRECEFGYKQTIFKQNKNLIILSCWLEMRKINPEEIKEKIDYVLNYRKKNHPLELPSAGSIFKNQKSKIENQKFLKKFPELRRFNRKGIIPAAYLIEKCGLKGKRIEDAQVSQKHANFIVNKGRAGAGDVRKLIILIKRRVKEKFGVKLTEEIQFVGF